MPTDSSASILLLCTGGTITMSVDPGSGSLTPFHFDQLNIHMPELRKFNYQIDYVQFDPLMDSSDVGPSDWIRMVEIILESH